jgi:hypothetical protein
MRWLIGVFALLLALLFILKGIGGIQSKRITGRWGKEFRGTTAQVVGMFYVCAGALAVLIALGLLLGVFGS